MCFFVFLCLGIRWKDARFTFQHGISTQMEACTVQPRMRADKATVFSGQVLVQVMAHAWHHNTSIRLHAQEGGALGHRGLHGMMVRHQAREYRNLVTSHYISSTYKTNFSNERPIDLGLTMCECVLKTISIVATLRTLMDQGPSLVDCLC